ncbi:MAG: hypothetical protein ACP5R2_15635 [Anaerolineae bacterium]
MACRVFGPFGDDPGWYVVDEPSETWYLREDYLEEFLEAARKPRDWIADHPSWDIPEEAFRDHEPEGCPEDYWLYELVAVIDD